MDEKNSDGILPAYLADVAREFRARSASIRRGFASHRPSAGANREDLVRRFLGDHLPGRYGVGNGLVISQDDRFSRQADLVIVDQLNNAPLYADTSNKLWPVESVYALLEVKTHLSPSELENAVEKGRRFKSLSRRFVKGRREPSLTDSLFVLWGFESSEPATLKENLIEALSDMPRSEQPDFVVVPNRLVAKSGTYLELAKLGQPGSAHRRRLEAEHGSDLDHLLTEPVEVYDLGDNSLLAWYVWLSSWLNHAGERSADLIGYLPPDRTYGDNV